MIFLCTVKARAAVSRALGLPPRLFQPHAKASARGVPLADLSVRRAPGANPFRVPLAAMHASPEKMPMVDPALKGVVKGRRPECHTLLSTSCWAIPGGRLSPACGRSGLPKSAQNQQQGDATGARLALLIQAAQTIERVRLSVRAPLALASLSGSGGANSSWRSASCLVMLHIPPFAPQ